MSCVCLCGETPISHGHQLNVIYYRPSNSVIITLHADWLVSWAIFMPSLPPPVDTLRRSPPNAEHHRTFLSDSILYIYTYRYIYRSTHSEHIGWLGKMESGDDSISPLNLKKPNENTLSQICDRTYRMKFKGRVTFTFITEWRTEWLKNTEKYSRPQRAHK